MEKSKISVIIPVYNAEKTIERCILSVTNGNYHNIEVIVVNDGSTDGTSEIITRLAQDDARIRIYYQENQGVSGARDKGLRQATGEYIAWCDSDDWYEPDCLSSLYDYLIKYDADMSICRARISGREVEYDPNELYVWNQDESIKAFFEHNLLNGVLPTKLIKKNLFDGLSFDSAIRFWEDLDMIWQILSRVERVVRFNHVKYNYITHPDSLCASRYSNQRAYSSLKVWNKIVKDCYGSAYYESACRQRYMWLYGELRLMLKDSYSVSEYSKEIIDIMRNTDIKLKKQDSWILNVFSFVCEHNLALAKLIIRIRH